MFEVILKTSGLYKDIENEFVTYMFCVDTKYTHKGFPAIKIKQTDKNGLIEFNVCQVDYLTCLIETISFIEKRAWLEDCEATIEGDGFFLLQPNFDLPLEGSFSIQSENKKIIDEKVSSPCYCEINIKNLFNKFRFYGTTPFQAFKNATLFLASIIKL